MAENADQPTPSTRIPPTDLEAASQVETAELDREWMARRMEAYRSLDAAVQRTLGNVIQSADEIRQAMEEQAEGVLNRLRHERARLVEDIKEQRRQRDGLAAEIAEARRKAEEDAARIRRAAEAERMAMLRDAETRKTELNGEIERLEQQLGEFSSAIQSLLHDPTARARPPSAPERAATGGVPPQAAARAYQPVVIEAEPTPPRQREGAPAGGGAAEGARAASAPGSGRAAGPPPAPADVPEPARAAAPPPAPADVPPTVAAPPGEPAAPTRAPGAVGPEERARLTETAPVFPPPVADSAGAPAAPPAAEPPPRPAPAAPAPAPATPAAARRAAPAEEAPAAAPERVEVAVSNTPSFARALELQRGIQRTQGVRQVQALQFERGTLVLAVEHDPGLDIAAAVQSLPNLGLELVNQGDDRIELRFAAA